MSTLDAIETEAKTMPERDLIKVLFFIRNLKTDHRNPFEPLTEDKILADLKVSEEQYLEGKYLDLDDAITAARKERGFI